MSGGGPGEGCRQDPGSQSRLLSYTQLLWFFVGSRSLLPKALSKGRSEENLDFLLITLVGLGVLRYGVAL